VKVITTAKIPTNVANYAAEIAEREYLRPSHVIRSLLMRGMLQHQLDEARRESSDRVVRPRTNITA
jgi:hypothetical protein